MIKKISSYRIRELNVKEIQKIVDTLVDTVNLLIERQENIRGAVSTSNATENQIKVERKTATTYNVMIRTKDGWAEQEFIMKEK